MGDFNHGHIQWKSLESTGGGRPTIYIFNSLELPYSARALTSGENVLYIVLSYHHKKN